ncbi:maltokinase N-terminal cap-like domain-containing protein [Planomonospora venezuelensis]|uniref:Maltokinase n=1 Tax=Planomonospora venezuelensis TaxID=1999 RepID=A0A841D6A9_PLAVE|nr:phosphotransferase [Planomonospora venezuelensis]MBB5962986.1 maltokinase [Planomonospora venezuelensis]GIN00554.1 aminoglycoside phosphotransferase [Planomonospora venezuelensis]
MLTELLTGWMTHQRWFAGKGRPIDGLAVDSDVELAPGLRHLIVSVRQNGARDRYQILLGCCESDLPDRLRHAQIGDGLYDAAHDADLTGVLLEAMSDGRDIGPLRFRHLEGVHIDSSPRSLVLGAEQSNTSLVYGETYICKLFRRLIPGVNPELEIVNALALRKAAHIAQPYGWIETDLDGEPTTLAMTQEFLSNANDGWALALASVRDLYASMEESASDAGGDFSAESFRLGTATAEVHHEMAAAFPTGVMDAAEVRRMVDDQRRKLEQAVAEVPELAEHAHVAEEAYRRVAAVAHDVPVQRVHGDYHLGQVMRTPTDWIVLDFEGEPGQPLAERRALSSPLRDVAGMLRSFDYAARHLLADHDAAEDLLPRAVEWAELNRSSFLAGYSAGGGRLRGEDAVLLRSLELAKAVYEVVYEARNRPSWLPIPLAAFGH